MNLILDFCPTQLSLACWNIRLPRIMCLGKQQSVIERQAKQLPTWEQLLMSEQRLLLIDKQTSRETAELNKGISWPLGDHKDTSLSIFHYKDCFNGHWAVNRILDCRSTLTNQQLYLYNDTFTVNFSENDYNTPVLTFSGLREILS